MIEKILKCMCTAFGRDPASITAQMTRGDIDEWDSIGMVRLALALEEEFHVSIPPEVARRMTSADGIAVELRKMGVQG